MIVSEDLQIKNMVKNQRLAKSISDVSWYELTRQLEYKEKWNGRKYVKIDTFYASSQLCSVCGYQNTETKKLSVREWTCPVCGTNHDRDLPRWDCCPEWRFQGSPHHREWSSCRAANICRWPELADVYSYFGSAGIPIMTIWQNPDQGRAAFGPAIKDRATRGLNVTLAA